MSLDAARVVGMPKVVFGALSRTVKLPCPTLAEPPVNGVDWTKDERRIYIVRRLKLLSRFPVVYSASVRERDLFVVKTSSSLLELLIKIKDMKNTSA